MASFDCDFGSAVGDEFQNPNAFGRTPRTFFSSLWFVVSVLLLLGGNIGLIYTDTNWEIAAGIAPSIFVSLLLLLSGRLGTQKRANFCTYSGITSARQETDFVPESAIWCIGLAWFIFPCTLAVLIIVAPAPIMPVVLGFSAITLYSLQRILRPAHRLDPVRTVLEYSAADISMDAIDGAVCTLLHESIALRWVAALSFVSIAVRMLIMCLSHLPPTSNWRIRTWMQEAAVNHKTRLHCEENDHARTPTSVDESLLQHNAMALYLKMILKCAGLCFAITSSMARLVLGLLWNFHLGPLTSIQVGLMMKGFLEVYRTHVVVKTYREHPMQGGHTPSMRKQLHAITCASRFGWIFSWVVVFVMVSHILTSSTVLMILLAFVCVAIPPSIYLDAKFAIAVRSNDLVGGVHYTSTGSSTYVDLITLIGFIVGIWFLPVLHAKNMVQAMITVFQPFLQLYFSLHSKRATAIRQSRTCSYSGPGSALDLSGSRVPCTWNCLNILTWTACMNCLSLDVVSAFEFMSLFAKYRGKFPLMVDASLLFGALGECMLGLLNFNDAAMSTCQNLDHPLRLIAFTYFVACIRMPSEFIMASIRAMVYTLYGNIMDPLTVASLLLFTAKCVTQGLHSIAQLERGWGATKFYVLKRHVREHLARIPANWGEEVKKRDGPAILKEGRFGKSIAIRFGAFWDTIDQRLVYGYAPNCATSIQRVEGSQVFVAACDMNDDDEVEYCSDGDAPLQYASGAVLRYGRFRVRCINTHVIQLISAAARDLRTHEPGTNAPISFINAHGRLGTLMRF